jgi:hypothetical protein
MSPAASPNDSSLLDALPALYAAAAVTVGREAAPDRVVQAYRQAAGSATPAPPTPDRPETRSAASATPREALPHWLHTLLDKAALPDEGSDAPPTAAPSAEAAAPDPLQQTVAESLLKETLPVALATCSPSARFALAAAALAPGAAAPDALPESEASEAPPSLGPALQSVLPDAQFALVDTAFSDADLRAALRSWLAAEYTPLPPTLQPRVQSTLAEARAHHSPAATPEAPDAAEASPPRTAGASRSLLGTLLGAALLVAGIGALSLLQPFSSSPSSSEEPLLPFLATQASTVSLDTPMTSRTDAEAYIASTWARRVQLPSLAHASLAGVGQVMLPSDRPVPVALYRDSTTAGRIAAFAYSYALADRSSRSPLPTAIRNALAPHRQPVRHTQDGTTGLLWRNRDDIFIALSTTIPVDSLRPRLHPSPRRP